jgi:hypothetical protein
MVVVVVVVVVIHMGGERPQGVLVAGGRDGLRLSYKTAHAQHAGTLVQGGLSGRGEEDEAKGFLKPPLANVVVLGCDGGLCGC